MHNMNTNTSYLILKHCFSELPCRIKTLKIYNRLFDQHMVLSWKGKSRRHASSYLGAPILSNLCFICIWVKGFIRTLHIVQFIFKTMQEKFWYWMAGIWFVLSFIVKKKKEEWRMVVMYENLLSIKILHASCELCFDWHEWGFSPHPCLAYGAQMLK